PQKQVGSAYALIFYGQNIGLMCVPMLIGWVNERFANSELADGTVGYDYTPTLLIFAAFGILAVALTWLLKVEDRRKNYGLELPNIKK
ncbi:MAG: MFS transporter, partial [Alistipes sp.]|nr:MFS transporter [Alistipes sp.]